VRDQATLLRELSRQAPLLQAREGQTPGIDGKVIAMASGKGGVGKTTLCANLAAALAQQGARVLLIEGDFYFADAHLLFGADPTQTLKDLAEGDLEPEELLLKTQSGVVLLPGSAGSPTALELELSLSRRISEFTKRARQRFDFVLLDLASGVSRASLLLMASADEVWIVTTPETASVTDAYAMAKVLVLRMPQMPLSLIVNLASSEEQGREVHAKLQLIASRFLDVSLAYRGYLPHTAEVFDAVQSGELFVKRSPNAEASRLLSAMARNLLEKNAG